MLEAFTFHHVGVAVPELEQAVRFYETAFGFQLVSGPFDDPVQKVKVCFLAEAGQSLGRLELISPLSGESPVNGYLSKQIGAYHTCYEVGDITETLAGLRRHGCLVICKPVPATAFGGRKIAWCYTPTNQLVELLEKDGRNLDH